jgi:hypothetical protein
VSVPFLFFQNSAVSSSVVHMIVVPWVYIIFGLSLDVQGNEVHQCSVSSQGHDLDHFGILFH